MGRAIVIYDQNQFLIKTSEGLYRHSIRSTSDTLIMEEISSVIKEKTQSSFLHAPDFTHFSVGSRHHLLPSALFDPSLIAAYDERIYGELAENFDLTASPVKSFQVHAIQAQDKWINALMQKYFNESAASGIHGFFLHNAAKSSNLSIDIHCFETKAFIGIYRENKIWYADFSSFEAIDDIVYTTLNAIQHFNFQEQDGILRLSSSHSTMQEDTMLATFERMAFFDRFTMSTGFLESLLSPFE